MDDEQDLVWAVQHSLRDEGYEVLAAYDGEEALAVARRHRPDLAILDIVMPRLDGLLVCCRLRRDPTLAAVPILFLTVRSAIEDRIKGLDEGGDDRKMTGLISVFQFGGKTEGWPSLSLRGVLLATKQSPNAEREIASLCSQ